MDHYKNTDNTSGRSHLESQNNPAKHDNRTNHDNRTDSNHETDCRTPSASQTSKCGRRTPLLVIFATVGLILISLGVVSVVLGTPGSVPEVSIPNVAVALDVQRIELPTGPVYVFSLGVMAPTEGSVDLQFNSGQRYDFTVLQDEQEMWRWSDGRAFHQAVHTQTVAAGTLQTYVHVWDGRNRQGELLSGTIIVTASLTTHTAQNAAVVKLEIK